MIKKCNVCSHVGELTWRDGKYYCAMCGSEIAETAPVVETPVQTYAQPNRIAANVTCPICKNKANNQFDGLQYHCSLCGTSFDLQQAAQAQQYEQYSSATSYQQKEKYDEVKKQKDRNTLYGIICIFLFWPASIYFFYKAYQANQQLKTMGY